MTYEEFNSEIKHQINNLSYAKQLGFAVIICKKLFFDYQRFYEVYHWGDPDLLIDAINFCEYSINKPIEIIQAQALLNKVEAFLPDMDDYNSDTIASYGLNACAAVCDSLQFLIDKDQNHIYSISTHYTDTVYIGLQENANLTQEQVEANLKMSQARSFVLSQLQ